jgi:ABC-type transport system involved in cytochrome bd biosynthesis fused ATPase/permease subunit
VRDNIALADWSMPIETIIAAAQMAGAHDFILELPHGYDTVVGERGSSLSGGQRQRLAIARAIITDPRILIFDEATSALDYESERIIQQNMPQLAHGRTVFIIAHRLSTVRRSDRLITIDRADCHHVIVLPSLFEPCVTWWTHFQNSASRLFRSAICVFGWRGSLPRTDRRSPRCNRQDSLTPS